MEKKKAMPSIAEIRELYKELLEAKKKAAILEQRLIDILELNPDTRKTLRKRVTTQEAVDILNAIATERR